MAGIEPFDGDLTWLLHRAAQRMRLEMEKVSARYGVDLRAYLVLTALARSTGQTQLALGLAIGVDKTTMTVLLDRLEKDGLVVRKADPADRRARLPTLTAPGRALQKKIARSVADLELTLLDDFTATDQRALRAMLGQLIGNEPSAGSCI